MTDLSPRTFHCYIVNGPPNDSEGVATIELPAIVLALKSGVVRRAVLAAGLVVEAARGPAPPQALAELRGCAATARLPVAEDPDDLQPARAIRRALADGGMRASEIDLVAVASSGPLGAGRAARAVSRGLGRFAERATLELDGEPGAACARAIERGSASGAVALIIEPAAGNVALAFSRVR